MTGFVRSQYVNVGATASAAIFAFGLVTVPAEGHDSVNVRIEFAAVQLQSAVADQISAVVNYAPYAAAETPELQVTKAAATAGDALSSAFSTVGRDLLLFVGTVLLPIWWVGLPITYPLYNFVYQYQNPGSGSFQSLILAAWLVAPLTVMANLGSALFPELTRGPAAASPRAGASAAMAPPTIQTARQRGTAQRGRSSAEVAASAIDMAAQTLTRPAVASVASVSDAPSTSGASELTSDEPPSGRRTSRTSRANENTAKTDAGVAGDHDLPAASGARHRPQRTASPARS